MDRLTHLVELVTAEGFVQTPAWYFTGNLPGACPGVFTPVPDFALKIDDKDVADAVASLLNQFHAQAEGQVWKAIGHMWMDARPAQDPRS